MTVPKLASGSTEHLTKHEEGASATHSADVRAALEDVCCVEKVAPVVTLLMVSVNVEPLTETSAAMLSPGCTAIARLTGAAGYISTQA